jgi:hypothetical protein
VRLNKSAPAKKESSRRAAYQYHGASSYFFIAYDILGTHIQLAAVLSELREQEEYLIMGVGLCSGVCKLERFDGVWAPEQYHMCNQATDLERIKISKTSLDFHIIDLQPSSQ